MPNKGPRLVKSSTPRSAASSTLRSPRGVIVAILVFLLLGAAIWAGVAAQSSTQQPAQLGVTPGTDSPSSQHAEQPALDMSRRIEGDPLAMGSVDAPVVLVEYADFRCPYCALYARNTLPTIIAEYVDSGQVRVEWRDMPLFGQHSLDAAVAGRAAAAQGLFWEFEAAVYAAAPERGHPDLPRELLLQFAEEIGVPDLDKFARDMEDPELLALVEADRDQALALGVTGTPSFLVNDTPLVGAQPIDVFRTVIDDALTRAGSN